MIEAEDALSPDALAPDALVERWRADPFAVLGPHQIGACAWEIRTLAPHAQAVRAFDAQTGSDLGAFTRAHEEGLWILRLATPTRPPSASTTWRTMYNPSPSPA